MPSAHSWLPDPAEDHHLGLYTKALSSTSGLVVLAGSSITGLLLDSVGDTPIPWLLLAAVPVACAVVLGTARNRASTHSR